MCNSRVRAKQKDFDSRDNSRVTEAVRGCAAMGLFLKGVRNIAFVDEPAAGTTDLTAHSSTPDATYCTADKLAVYRRVVADRANRENIRFFVHGYRSENSPVSWFRMDFVDKCRKASSLSLSFVFLFLFAQFPFLSPLRLSFSSPSSLPLPLLRHVCLRTLFFSSSSSFNSVFGPLVSSTSQLFIVLIPSSASFFSRFASFHISAHLSNHPCSGCTQQNSPSPVQPYD